MPQPPRLWTLDPPPAADLFDGENFLGFERLNAELAERLGLDAAEVERRVARAVDVIRRCNVGLGRDVDHRLGLELALRICCDSFDAAARGDRPADSQARHDVWLAEAFVEQQDRDVVRVVVRMVLDELCAGTADEARRIGHGAAFAALRMSQAVEALNERWPADGRGGVR